MTLKSKKSYLKRRLPLKRPASSQERSFISSKRPTRNIPRALLLRCGAESVFSFFLPSKCKHPRATLCWSAHHDGFSSPQQWRKHESVATFQTADQILNGILFEYEVSCEAYVLRFFKERISNVRKYNTNWNDVLALLYPEARLAI